MPQMKSGFFAVDFFYPFLLLLFRPKRSKLLLGRAIRKKDSMGVHGPKGFRSIFNPYSANWTYIARLQNDWLLKTLQYKCILTHIDVHFIAEVLIWVQGCVIWMFVVSAFHEHPFSLCWPLFFNI